MLLNGGDVGQQHHVASDDGRFERPVSVGGAVTFVVGGYRNEKGGVLECGRDGTADGVFVWFESVDTKAVLSAPALPVDGGDLVAEATFDDPGEYRVHVVGHGRTVLEAGARGTVASILPARKSPWSFEVVGVGEAVLLGEGGGGGGGEGSPTTRFELPTRICDFADLENSSVGRWVECEAAGVPPSDCLSDGWVYVPRGCRHPVAAGIDALEQSKAIADARGGKPIWIVVTGSSIERGTLHALVDLVAGIGMLEGEGRVDRSVADALFGNVEDVRGEGSTTKCWGWIDVQVGNIRLSYQDARTIYMNNDPESDWAEPTNNRWHELIGEKPDLVVFGLWEGGMREYDLAVSQVMRAVADTPDFDGLVAFHPTNERILNDGIAKTYTCRTDTSLPPTAPGNVQSSTTMLRDIIDKFLSECTDCESLGNGERIAVADEMIMSWSFLFDMERPMSSEIASQHFHRYVTEALPRPACGSRHSGRRYVVGAVTEMAAQMYLGAALSHAAERAGVVANSEALLPQGDRCAVPDDEGWEVSLATRHPFRACFTCPVSALPFKPPLSPAATLSAPVLVKKIDKFDVGEMGNQIKGMNMEMLESKEDDGNLEFCYEPQN